MDLANSYNYIVELIEECKLTRKERTIAEQALMRIRDQIFPKGAPQTGEPEKKKKPDSKK